MKGYWENRFYAFARGVFPAGRVIDLSLDTVIPDVYDYVFVRDSKYIEGYYSHLSEGGIIAGEGRTNHFGDDITYLDGHWLHVKPHKAKFNYRPVVLTIQKRKEAEREMAKWGIEADYFEGVKHKHGHIGCGLSYKAIFEQYKDQNVMVFEDDIKFIRDPHTFDLPMTAFDAVFLGANLLNQCERLDANFQKVGSSWTTHAVYYDKEFTKRISKEYIPQKGVPIDEWMNRNNCRRLVSNPFFALQRPGHSLIENTERDYSLIIFTSQRYLK